MSQSINSDKSVSCIKIEYHSGSRNSKQILYNNNLFGYYRDDKWRCTDKKCLATISVDVSTDTITDVSKANHVGHNGKSPCEIEVRRAIEQMKIDVRNETTLDPKEIYSRNIEAVIKKGHHLSDIHNFIAPYIKFRGTLNKIKEKERPPLPKSLRDIDFKLPIFKQWTETVWNYHNFIGRQTNNDVEGFNRICNRLLRSQSPCIFKFIDALKRFDQEMSLQVEYYKRNPLDPFGYPKSSKQKQKEEAFINLKNAYEKEELTLEEYIFAVASQIEPTQYLNEPLCGEVLGGLGGDDIIAKVADDFNFELNDSCTRGIVNDEINRENFNFDVANLGGLIDVPHNVDNPVVSTNNDYFLPSNTRPNDSLVSIVGVDQFGFNKSLDYDGHSTLLNIPLVPKVTAAVFPAETPKEDC